MATREAPPQLRQLSGVTLGGVTLLLVVAFAINASPVPRDANWSAVHRAEVARSIVAAESARVMRRAEEQRPVPTAMKATRRPAVRSTASPVTPDAPAPVTTLAFRVPVLKADLPPPARA
jgi:hypothetical protein